MMLTIDEVAALLNISAAKAYHLAKRGEIPGRRIGREWRFHPAQIGCFMFGEDSQSAPVGI